MSGFIYLWHDRKYNRYYVGKHWGAEDDGYICSSTWMQRSYLRRPDDFRRRILERVVSDRQDLREAEYRWGLLIKDEELGKRYYNLERPGKKQWHDSPETRLTVGQKISAAQTGKKRGPHSEETKLKIAASQTGKKRLNPRRGYKRPKEFGDVMRKALTGRKLSEEHRANISSGYKGGWPAGKGWTEARRASWMKRKTMKEMRT